jgi:hypothetical protein
MFSRGKKKQNGRRFGSSAARKLGRAFSDIVDATFHPEGIIYGHFLSATSEDAVVSGDVHLISGLLETNVPQ